MEMISWISIHGKEGGKKEEVEGHDRGAPGGGKKEGRKKSFLSVHFIRSPEVFLSFFLHHLIISRAAREAQRHSFFHSEASHEAHEANWLCLSGEMEDRCVVCGAGRGLMDSESEKVISQNQFIDFNSAEGKKKIGKPKTKKKKHSDITTRQ